ncbi:lysozyme inhibitor LprI family protein [Donghicola mangrovi]|uniref:DUF1311 domain-containing protein n=1 Tax=Donghicola mangrovi TaxID=2729614 RepID=A0A850Q6Y6_9RHOB|nr:lysozyme inhibitor LprI family protein [Donghicola mangrovi]NVO24886.1 DUF1311 domain-containing protein [Donghicola mangrovi]
MNIRLFIALGLIAGPVWAAEDTPEELRAACFEMSAMMGQLAPCAGEAAQVCLEAKTGSANKGASAAVMAECFAPEAEWWDQKATAEYERVLADFQKMNAADQSEAVKAFHAAWLTYRDAKCDVAIAGFGLGAGSNLPVIICRMNESAEHAVYLSVRGK